MDMTPAPGTGDTDKIEELVRWLDGEIRLRRPAVEHGADVVERFKLEILGNRLPTATQTRELIEALTDFGGYAAMKDVRAQLENVGLA